MEAALPPPSMAGTPRALFIQNHCAKSGKLGFFETNSGSVNEPLMWEVRFLLGMGGDRSIGEANLRKGRQPLLWPARLAPGWHAPRLDGTPCA